MMLYQQLVCGVALSYVVMQQFIQYGIVLFSTLPIQIFVITVKPVI